MPFPPASTVQGAYRPQLDGVRAFCIIFTILNHVPDRPWFINGTVGVDCFFALSGWLITWLLISEQAKTGAIDLMGFYIRRIFRIMPLYYLVLAIYVIAAFAQPTGGKLAEMYAAAPWLATFNSEFRPAAAGDIYGHAWTLGIEEKFYLFWPALMVFIVGRRWWAVLLVVAVIIALIGIAPATVGIRGYFGLGVGTVLALLVNRYGMIGETLRKRAYGVPLVIALCGAYVAAIAFQGASWPNLLVAALSGLLVANLWFNQNQAVSRFLSMAPLAYVGRLTYAIYLIQSLAKNVAVGIGHKVHFLSSFTALFAMTYAISIIGAIALHRLVEKPLTRLGRRIAEWRASPRVKTVSAAAVA